VISWPSRVLHQYDCEHGIMEGVGAGKVIVDCATLSPQHMQQIDQRVAGKGGQFLEAPVSGTK
jgi:3-hydroxyisobutyrate dehydrogenase